MLRRRLTIAAIVMIAIGSFTTTQAYSSEKKTTGTEDYTACEKIEGQTIDIPLSTVAKGNPGEVKVLATKAVAEAIQGNEGKVSFTANNNNSVHPGSDLIVQSGSDRMELKDVESSNAKVTTGNGTLVLGSALTVSVKIGEDYIFSGGGMLQIEFTCPEKPAATTTTKAPTTTTPPTTVAEFTNCEKAPTLEVPVEVFKKGEAGKTYSPADFAVDPKFKDNEAALTFTGKNNGSVHPGSDLIVTSGNDKVTLTDVEGKAGKITEHTGTLKLADKVDIGVKLGKDGMFSGGGTLLLDIVCTEKPAPTTTTAAPTTTTTAAPAATTTTTTAAPVVKTAELSRTGADSTLLSLFGTLLVLSGLVMLMGSRLAGRRA